tara:strand:- start:1368 stop:1586 length:219 start_codon:yes stop_codon:yes gene_type:complete
MIERLFKVGDLVELPDTTVQRDYGIVLKVEDWFDAGYGGEYIHYHIHWAIDGELTIEDDRWVHQNIKLVERA